MKKFIAHLLIWFFWVLAMNLIWGNVYAQQGIIVPKAECDWIALNTKFPIIWNCIPTENSTNAFPFMIEALVKIVMALILVVCFIFIIVAWILWAADNPAGAKKIIKKVAVTILVLWFAWTILTIVNPNFFGDMF